MDANLNLSPKPIYPKNLLIFKGFYGLKRQICPNPYPAYYKISLYLYSFYHFHLETNQLPAFY